mmetsp:Transcript_65821/g.174525  ORF Transcript_65821/g.174525 Transcript_65821/m.174525 type:complete len:88 (+) Transcript_65821:542-805(+)
MFWGGLWALGVSTVAFHESRSRPEGDFDAIPKDLASGVGYSQRSADQFLRQQCATSTLEPRARFGVAVISHGNANSLQAHPIFSDKF